MVSATESAFKPSARWLWVCLGLTACFTDVGCARLRSYQQGTSPPILGAAAPFGKEVQAPGGDLYAREVGKGIAQSRTLLAQEHARNATRARTAATVVRSTAHPSPPPSGSAGGADSPLDVALQPPVPIRPGTTPPPFVTPGPSAVAAASPANPVGAPASDASAARVATIVAASRARLDALKSYQVTFQRQERVGEVLQPAEEVLLSIRREPKAVRLEWPSGPHQGREVIYATGKGSDGLMHVNMADSIVPVPPLALAPDSPLAVRSSRHPITEAGFEAIIDGLEKTIRPAAADNRALGKVTYEGLDNPGQLARPCHKLVRVTPTGETWHVYIDPESSLPTMVEGTLANGDLLERYVFGVPKVNLDALASADAFDPERRWKAAEGLLQRLARANGTKPAPEPPTR